MTREALIRQTFKIMKALPDERVQEVSDFVHFLVEQYKEEQITKDIAKITEQSYSFDFLNEEEDLYTISDLKEIYKND